MSTALINFALQGIEANRITVEVSLRRGEMLTQIIGMANQNISEAKERIHSAFGHMNMIYPKCRVTYNLAPTDMHKNGNHYELTMAIALLIESRQLVTRKVDNIVFFGELGLNGDLRPCKGILPLVIAAKEAGYENVFIPLENLEEASLVEHIQVFAFENLAQVLRFLEGESDFFACSLGGEVKALTSRYSPHDFSEVRGQHDAVKKAVIAAAGGHNLLLIGEPGCGKSMIASRMPGILPAMSREEIMEVTKIHSVAGLLGKRGNLVTTRPFLNPHHNTSLNALIGGGAYAHPGAVSLAHNGVLFLDEIVEFSRKTLEALRQPIEDQQVHIARVKESHTFPANFMLVAAMNPCPCGFHGSNRCTCTAKAVVQYQQKLSGPIMDRIDLIHHLGPIDFLEPEKSKPNQSSARLKDHVERARAIQKERFVKDSGIRTNAQMDVRHIDRYCQLDEATIAYLRTVKKQRHLTARRYNRALRVARTIADLSGHDAITLSDMRLALSGEA